MHVLLMLAQVRLTSRTVPETAPDSAAETDDASEKDAGKEADEPGRNAHGDVQRPDRSRGKGTGRWAEVFVCR